MNMRPGRWSLPMRDERWEGMVFTGKGWLEALVNCWCQSFILKLGAIPMICRKCPFRKCKILGSFETHPHIISSLFVSYIIYIIYIYILNLQFCWLIPRFWWVETPIWFSSTSLHRNWNRFNSDKVVSQPQHYWVQQGTGKHNCGVVSGVPCSKQGWSFQTCEGRILEIVVTCHFPLKNVSCPWPT